MNEGERKNCVFDPNCAYHFQLEQTKDEAELLKNKEILESVVQGKKSSYQVKLTNTDRTFGTLLGAEVTRHHPSGLPEDTITILCQGSGRTKLRRISAQRDHLVFCAATATIISAKASPAENWRFMRHRKQTLCRKKMSL